MQSLSLPSEGVHDPKAPYGSLKGALDYPAPDGIPPFGAWYKMRTAKSHSAYRESDNWIILERNSNTPIKWILVIPMRVALFFLPVLRWVEKEIIVAGILLPFVSFCWWLSHKEDGDPSRAPFCYNPESSEDQGANGGLKPQKVRIEAKKVTPRFFSTSCVLPATSFF